MTLQQSKLLVPPEYEGRTQAFVKHKLLESYLERLFLIIGLQKPAELCYVDCFAGPWGSESDDLSGTSIAISLDVLSSCKKQLAAKGIFTKVRALYVERDAIAFTRLQSYLAKHSSSDVKATALNGDFAALRTEIVNWTGKEGFTFFFIDPKGWSDVGIDVLRPLLERPRSEFLINFMYDFVNRTMSMSEWRSEMRQLVGEELELDGLSPVQRETKILNAYQANLKRQLPTFNTNYPARSARARVLDPTKQLSERPKYHLVYLTSHAKGIEVFMDISSHVDLIQRRVRASMRSAAREKQSRIKDMFDENPDVDANASYSASTETEDYWLAYLGDGERTIDLNAFADILEETGWFPSDLQAALSRLIETKRVVNLNALKQRPKRPLHYESKGGETLKLASSS
jgi:three-Cys-motif partner protein